MLTTIAYFVQEKKCDLWSSNNKEVVELIEALVGKLKDCVFSYKKVEPYSVDIKKLISSRHGFVGTDVSDFDCDISVDIKLELVLEEN